MASTPSRGLVCTFAAAGILVALLAAPAGATGAPQDRRLEELWEEFPLEPETATPSERPAGEQPRPEEARQDRESARPASGTEDARASTATWTMLTVLAGFVIVAGAGAVALAATRGALALPRPARAERPAVAQRTVATRRVVDDLARAAGSTQFRPKTREVKMVTRKQPAVPSSDAGRLKARPHVDWSSEKLAATAHADATVLKRKSDADDPATELKRSVATGPKEKTLGSEAATTELKEKLTARPPKRTPQRTRSGKRESALRPLLAPGEQSRRDRTRAIPVAAATRECEIRRWRGYTTSQFLAVTTGAEGVEATIGVSPSFRWRKAELPEFPAAAAALRALVDSLEQEGWQVAGRGEEWYAVRLRADGGNVGAGMAGARR